MSEPQKPQEPAKPSDGDESMLTPAELKKRAKAEKQARRAAAKEQQGSAAAPPSATNGVPEKANPTQEAKSKVGQQKSSGQVKSGKQGAQQDGKQELRPALETKTVALRRRGSQSGGGGREVAKRDSKQVELFSHLYVQPRRHQLEHAHKDVHPAVQQLGLQISRYQICGSSARCVGMLLAFKQVIRAYDTPAGTSLPRHLTHHLSPQIEWLKASRPLGESMGNAIRWLKKLVVEIDPSMDQQAAKDYLCAEIDRFLRERIAVTDQVIAAAAAAQIRPDAVVLTYAKSAIVEQTLRRAHAAGTSFRVVCLDSRPLFEGRALARSLVHAGIEVEYLPYSGLAYAMQHASLVLLGAHSMLSNGRLMSRVGTAGVAMQAHLRSIPVIVCCESVKFSGKVALDSIVLNEVAPAEELLPAPPQQLFSPADSDGGLAKDKEKADGDDDEAGKVKTLSDWKEIPGLQILNLMYDVTPAEYIRMVICEYGSVPPSSVPVVHRLANEGM